MAISPKQ